MTVEVKHFGTPGHFIGDIYCRFHLCTGVGQYLISTVGEYYPPSCSGEMVTLGIADDSFYETYVFEKCTPCLRDTCDCGMPIPQSYSEIEGIRTATRRAANDTHAATVAKYIAIAEEESCQS